MYYNTLRGVPFTANVYTALLAMANEERIKQIAIAIQALR